MKILKSTLSIQLFILFLTSSAALAQFDESYFDMAGIKGGYYLQNSEYDNFEGNSEATGYGGALFYDRQINGYFTTGYMLEYFRRDVVFKYNDADQNELISEEDRTTSQRVLQLSILLKFFPIGDFWFGLGPQGSYFQKPDNLSADAGVAFAIGYNWWISWGNRTDFGQLYYSYLVIAPEVRIAYNLTNQNDSRNQLDIMFYLGVGTRAFRPEFY